jgi:hypothetical protein
MMIEINYHAETLETAICEAIVTYLGCGMPAREIIDQLISRGFIRDPGKQCPRRCSANVGRHRRADAPWESLISPPPAPRHRAPLLHQLSRCPAGRLGVLALRATYRNRNRLAARSTRWETRSTVSAPAWRNCELYGALDFPFLRLRLHRNSDEHENPALLAGLHVRWVKLNSYQARESRDSPRLNAF